MRRRDPMDIAATVLVVFIVLCIILGGYSL